MASIADSRYLSICYKARGRNEPARQKTPAKGKTKTRTQRKGGLEIS